MSRQNRTLLLLALAGVVGLGALVVHRISRPGPETPEPPRVPVQVRAPELDTAWIVLPYRGTLEGDRDATLSFRMGGQVARLHVREGQEVAVGALLAELDAAELDAALEKARAEVARARAQEAHWEEELEVDERLFHAGAVSRSRVEGTRLSHRSAVLAREAADAAVAEVRARGSGARLRASHSGTVSRVEVAEGESVLPGQPVLTLSGGDRRVRVEVLERDRALGVRPGTPVRIAVPGCEVAEGRVTMVDAAARPPFGSTRVHVSPEGLCLQNLSPGTSVEVTFRLEGAPDALFVPLSAVDFRGGAPRVFRLVADDTVEAVPVTLGTQRGNLQEVHGALEPDDLVVVVGATNLRPGDRVRVVGEGEGGGP
jgi:RND family efflux transporter MFP subunit